MASNISPARKWVDRLAASIPLSVYSRAVRREAIGFCYHAVCDEPLPHVSHLIASKTPAAFEHDLLYLKDRYSFISYADLAAHRSGKRRLPRKAVLLTFDDGYTECYTVVRPLLLKHGIPAVFFLISNCVDNRSLAYRNLVSLCIDRLRSLPRDEIRAELDRVGQEFGIRLEGVGEFEGWIKPMKLPEQAVIERVADLLGIDRQAFLSEHQPYLSTQQVQAMHGEGFTFGGHSRRHPSLADLEQAEAEAEIVGSCETVRAITGQEQVPFAFPFSAHRVERSFLAGLRRRHPWLGLFFDTKGIQGDVPFILSRITADTSAGTGPDGTNIPWLLHTAYQRNFSVRAARFIEP